MTGAYRKLLAKMKSWSPLRSLPQALAPEWALVARPLLGVPSVQLMSEPIVGIGHDRPARRAAFQIVEPRRRRRLERLERVKISVVVIHGRVAGLIAADHLVIINVVRAKVR